MTEVGPVRASNSPAIVSAARKASHDAVGLKAASRAAYREIGKQGKREKRKSNRCNCRVSLSNKPKPQYGSELSEIKWASPKSASRAA